MGKYEKSIGNSSWDDGAVQWWWLLLLIFVKADLLPIKNRHVNSIVCIYKYKYIYIYIPIGSMVLVYMLTWLGYIDGKCYHIWHTCILWDIYIYIKYICIYLTQTHLKVWKRFGFSVRPTSGPLGVPKRGPPLTKELLLLTFGFAPRGAELIFG